MPISRRFFGFASLAMLVAGFAVLALIAASSIFLAARTREQGNLVAHTMEVRQKVAELGTLIERGEGARRGYLITGNAGYIRAAGEAGRQLIEIIDQIRSLMADNPPQQARLAQLLERVRERNAVIAASIAEARDGDLDQARKRFEETAGATPITAIRRLLAEMLQEEAQLLDERGRSASRAADTLTLVTVLGGIGILLLAAASILLVRNYTHALHASQEELRAANEGLEEAVQERTADLTHANEEIQRFAYIVSHDLRAPLVNIMGFTTEIEAGLPALREAILAAEEDDPDKPKSPARLAVEEDLPEALGFIRSSTDKMDRQINAILKLSREGRRVFAPERLNTTAMLQAIADTVHHQATEGDAAIRIEPAPAIVSDRLAFEQVFGNLIDNAVKYLDPARPGLITVRGHEAGRMAVFEIEDNGRGIDPRDHERIFDLFRRSGAQDKPGEGIGLAHVRALVRRMGGSITCTSELGRGTTFRVVLPKYIMAGRGGAS